MDLPGTASSDVLAQPTRARLFRLLEELRGPARTGELARRLGLHPNGVRTHLEALHREGLVTREKDRGRPGRPPDRWAIAPDARPAGEPPRAYGDLSRWLARAIPASPARIRDVEGAGREIGRDLAPPSEAPAGERLRDALAALGFQPAVEAETGGGFRCRLRNCPYRDSVRENREVVCALHRGITRGLLDAIAPGSRLAAFEPRDPDTAGCAVEVSGLAPHGGEGGT